MTGGAAPHPTRLHSTVFGSGPPVLFCHGLFGQGRNWTAAAKALSGQHRVILVDLPNHGRSPWTDRFSYLDVAAAVAHLLDELCGSEPAAVVGHSMGGKVAMVLALTQPERVERLCVVDVAPVAYRGLSPFTGYVRGMRALDLEHLPDRAAASEDLRPYVPDDVVRSFLLQNLRRDGDRWRWQLNLARLGNELDTLSGWPSLDVLPYRGPVLWLAGADSPYVRPEYAEQMRRLFPTTRLVTIKGAGHWVHSERPKAFLQTLRMFLPPTSQRAPAATVPRTVAEGPA